MGQSSSQPNTTSRVQYTPIQNVLPGTMEPPQQPVIQNATSQGGQTEPSRTNVNKSVPCSTPVVGASIVTLGRDESEAVPCSTPVVAASNATSQGGQTEPSRTDVNNSVPCSIPVVDASVLEGSHFWSSIQLQESTKDADICMIYREEEMENVHKLKQLLTRFILLEGGRKLIFFQDEQIGQDRFDWLSMAVACSRFKFLYIDDDIKDEWLKYQQHIALYEKITRSDRSIVPVKAHRKVSLPNLLGIYTPLVVTNLLRNKTLDDIPDVGALSTEDVDLFQLKRVANIFKGTLAAQAQASSPVSQPASKVFQVMRRHNVYLIETLDPENGLLDYLFQLEVINVREREVIRVKSTFHEKNQVLVSKLQLQTDGNFLKFIDALEQSGQRHIATRLLSDYR